MSRSRCEVLEAHYGVGNMDEIRKLRTYSPPPWPPLELWSKLKLPYTATNHPTLPSSDEIERAMESHCLQPEGFIDVCRVGECVVKLSGCPSIVQEAENLLFLQDFPAVQAPKVYAVCELGGIYHLVMEFIEGETLSTKKWLAMDSKLQNTICLKLAEQLQSLRSIPSDAGYYGRIHAQGWAPSTSFVRIRQKEMCGPYHTYEQLCSAMYASAELRLAVCPMDATRDYFQREKDFLLNFMPILKASRGSKPVLTHTDIKFENIIVRKGEKEDDLEVILIDWETLGWMPAFMQAIAFHTRILLTPEAKKELIEKVWFIFEEEYEEEKKLFKTFFYYGVV